MIPRSRGQIYARLTCVLVAALGVSCEASYSDSNAGSDAGAIGVSRAALQPSNPDLVGYWNFEEGSGTVANDSSGFNNTGQVINATWALNGRAGRGLYFNGINSVVKIPNGSWNQGPPGNPGGTSATYSLWYKTATGPTGWIVDHQLTGTVPGAFSIAANVVATGYDATYTSFTANSGPSAPGQWTMATLVFTPSQVKLYKNGTLRDTKNITNGVPRIPYPLWIGARGSVSQTYFKGWIDEVAVYRVALSDAEVTSLYQLYQPPTSTPDPTTGLIGKWTFDEGTGTLAGDESGYGALGQLSNTTWDANGRSGSCLYFNGTSSKVTVPDGMWNQGTPATYAWWYKPDGPAQGYVLEHHLSGASAGAFAFVPAEFRFTGYDATTTGQGTPFYAGPPSGTWAMASAVVSATQIKVYKNGLPLGSFPVSGGFPKIAGPLYFGARGSVGDGYFKGWIDEVSVYNRAFTDAEVFTLYKNTGLVGRWTLDEGTGLTANDTSGYGSPGQLSNATWDPNGRSGACLYFNGTNAKVTIPDGMWNQGSPETLSFWYKSDGSAIGNTVDHALTGVGAGRFAFYPNWYRFVGYDGTTTTFDARYGGPPAGTWAMVTLVVTGNQIKTYKNATLLGTAPITSGIPYFSAPLYLGARGGVPDTWFKGWIDDVFIYKGALSDADIQTLYQVGQCGTNSQCAPGNVCAYGIESAFGLPPGSGTCWDAGECAKLNRSPCGHTGDKCGNNCCVSNCGSASGTPDGCGGTCQACVPGADSDGDGLLDCDERSDAFTVTNSLVFNPDCGDAVLEAGEVCDPALSPYCKADCSGESAPRNCSGDADCPSGEACGQGNGAFLGGDPTQNYCWPKDPCSKTPSQACGTASSACGASCACVASCSNKACGDDPSDGCGGQCPALCASRESGCTRDTDCVQGNYCAIGAGPRYGFAEGTNVCMPMECQDYIPSRIDCGTTSSLCGECPISTQVVLLDTHCSPGCGATQYCSQQGFCVPRDATVKPTEHQFAPNTPTPEVGPVSGAFAVSDNGTAQYTIPISIPPGRAGVEPQLALQYDSGAGDGFVAHGWSLSGLPAITRCPKTYASNGEAVGVLGTIEDAYCLNGEQLVVTNGRAYGSDGAEYRTELDSFTKVVSIGSTLTGAGAQAGPQRFQAFTKDGRILNFGLAPGSRRTSGNVALVWYVSSIEDHHGNSIQIMYEEWERDVQGAVVGERVDVEENRPIAIYYTAFNGGAGSRKILFNYDNTKQELIPRRFIAGAAIRASSPLTSIETYVENQLVKRYRLVTRAVGATWLLDDVKLCVPSSSGERCLPSTHFTYDESDGQLAAGAGHETFARYDATKTAVFDFDGDGDDDLLSPNTASSNGAITSWTLRLSRGAVTNDRFFDNFDPLVVDDNGQPSSALGGCAQFRVFDFNEDGRDDLYAECPNPSSGSSATIVPRYVFVSTASVSSGNQTGPGFKTFLVDTPSYNKDLPAPRSSLVDLDSDGRLDYVRLQKPQGCTAGVCTIGAYNISWRHNLGPNGSSGRLDGLANLGLTTDYEFGDHDGNEIEDLLIARSGGGAIFSVVNNQVHERTVDQAPPGVLLYPFLSVDVNGDGRADRLYDTQNGSEPPPAGVPLNFQQTLELLLNTGKGYVWAGSRSGMPSLYTGGLIPVADPPYPIRITRTAMFAFDRDNDGRQELYMAPGPYAASSFWLEHDPFGADGTTWDLPQSSAIPYRGPGHDAIMGTCPGVQGPCATPDLELHYRQLQEAARPLVADIDGDGVKDLVLQSGPFGTPPLPPLTTQGPVDVEVQFARSRTRHLLTVIDTGSLEHTAIGYDVARLGTNTRAYARGTSCVYPQRCAKRTSNPVVAEHVVSGVGSPYRDPAHPAAAAITRHFEYTYGDGRIDMRGRGWLGYSSRGIKEIAADTPDPVTGAPRWRTVETTTYGYDLATYDETLKRAWKAGRPAAILRVQTTPANPLTNATATLHYSISTYTYHVYTSDAGVSYVALDQEAHSKTDNGTTVSYVQNAMTNFDPYGDAKNRVTVWGANQEGPRIFTTIEYEDRSDLLNQWLVALPRQITILSRPFVDSSTGVKTIEVRAHYDSRGLPDQITRAGSVDGQPLIDKQTTIYGYDPAFGNPQDVTETSLTSPVSSPSLPPRSVHVDYDTEGYFPKTIKNGVHDAAGLPPATVSHDPRDGSIQFQRSPSGDWVAMQYDGVGRLQWSLDSGGSTTTVSYGAGTQAGGPLQTLITSTGAPIVTVEYNSFGQPMLQRVRRGIGQQAWQQETWTELGYDDFGRLQTRGVPHFQTDASPGAMHYAYDDLGRITSEDSPSQTAATPLADTTPVTATTLHFYASKGDAAAGGPAATWLSEPGAIRVHVAQDPLGFRTVQTLNMRGKTIASVDAKNGTARYTYGGFDYLQTAVFAGVTTGITNDELGQTTRYQEPHRGVYDYVYNGFGDLDSSTRNPGTSTQQLTTYAYDGLGRQTSITSPDGTYTWEWDGDGTDPSAIGQLVRESLSSSTVGTSSTRYEYHGPMGAASLTEREIDGALYTTRFAYNAQNLLETVRYPSTTPLNVKYSYNGQGEVTSVTDADNASLPAFWTLGSLDAFGSVASATYLNGVTMSRTRDTRNGLLRRARAVKGTQVLQDDLYTYDIRGLLAFRGAPDFSSGQTFGNDELGRLVSNTVVPSGTPFTYAYDPAGRGNLRSSPTLGTLNYTDPATPDRVRTTSDGHSYGYDAYGNQSTRTRPDGTGQSLAYTSFDLPLQLSEFSGGVPQQVTQFEYDAANTRIARSTVAGSGTPISSTTYVGDLYRKDVIAGAGTRHTAVVFLPDGAPLEVDVTTSTRQYHYSHLDNLGSTVAVSGTDGTHEDQRSYSPFGASSDTTWTSNVIGGYTGHEHDRGSGLINARGRMYDPELGRFLSPDPVVAGLFNTQALNPYSYVMNSPGNLVDPSGMVSDCTPANNCSEGPPIVVTGTRESSDPNKETVYSFDCQPGDPSCWSTVTNIDFSEPAGLSAGALGSTGPAQNGDTSGGQKTSPTQSGSAGKGGTPPPLPRPSPPPPATFDPLRNSGRSVEGSSPIESGDPYGRSTPQGVGFTGTIERFPGIVDTSRDYQVIVEIAMLWVPGGWIAESLEKIPLVGRLLSRLVGGSGEAARGAFELTRQSGGTLLRAATQAFKGGSLTNAGRALTKHPELLGFTKETLRQTLRSDAAINAAAEGAVGGILRSGTAAVRELPRYGSVIEVTGGSGFGARWAQQTGEFIGFINP